MRKIVIVALMLAASPVMAQAAPADCGKVEALHETALKQVEGKRASRKQHCAARAEVLRTHEAIASAGAEFKGCPAYDWSSDRIGSYRKRYAELCSR